MPIQLRHFSRYLASRLHGWRLPLVIALFVFATSWLAMWLVEPAGSDLVRARNYWWYFVVTAATVGYGDFFPESTGGHVVGAYVIVGGIVTLTVLFTRLSDSIQRVRGRRMRGMVAVDLDDHVVLLGYTPGRTERILSELTAEGRLRVALCAWDDVPQDPVPDLPQVEFVRGDLASADVLERAGIATARTAVIDARDDNEALAIAVAVDHSRPDIHLVAALRDLGRRQHLAYVNPGVQCVQWHMPFLLTEEALDPGITQVYQQLMSTGGHGNTYSLTVPEAARATPFGDWQTRFGRAFGATVIAVRTEEGLVVSPPWDRPVGPGATLYYVASERLDAARLLGER